MPGFNLPTGLMTAYSAMVRVVKHQLSCSPNLMLYGFHLFGPVKKHLAATVGQVLKWHR